MSAIISSNRRYLAKFTLKEALNNIVSDVIKRPYVGEYEENQLNEVVDHICDAVHEEIRGWLRAEGVIK